jgi:hypothetical protein
MDKRLKARQVHSVESVIPSFLAASGTAGWTIEENVGTSRKAWTLTADGSSAGQ